MEENFSSDRPVSIEQDDKFQRYPFAKRVADTIIARESEDCLVIGIYGAWGEGKTSVINFIESELKRDENIISIKFNPWRYNDENSLLVQFFEKLALELDTNLKTKGEKIGSLLQKYGKFLKIDIPIIGGNIGEAAENAGNALAKVDIEILKDRIGKILKDKKSKVVIFIDDIDRLDKTEIHSIFRLVKLTADFSNTIYILSFDEEMVSAAIGERFGEGNQKAGQNFLEKIIQVPLKIPVAQVDALKQFCFEQVNKVINANDLKLTDAEAQRFVNEFTSNILPQLTTPRLAVRYVNSLAFSLPLLAGEVNLVDLMLIEAIKIFSPNHYEFVRNNPDYFIGSYSSSGILDIRKDEKIADIKQHIELLGEALTKKQKTFVQNLLVELFPRLNEPFHNHAHDDKNYTEWFKNKRIVSSQYFNRYFTYAVIKGDISDVAFQNFVSKTSSQSIEDIRTSMKVLVEQSSPDKFLQKLRVIEDEFDWETSVKIAKAVATSSELFPKSEGSFSLLGYDAPKSQAAILIYRLIKQHANKDEQFSLAKELMQEAEPFEFAYELNNWLRRGNDWDKIFTGEQYSELAMIMISRALKEADKQPIFEKFHDFATIKYLLGSWAEQDKPELEKYISGILNENPSQVLNLLNAFTPMALGGYKGGTYKSDFTKEIYNYLTFLTNKDVFNEAIKKVYQEDEINKETFVWINMGENEQSDLNIVRQFRHWYQESISAEAEQDKEH